MRISRRRFIAESGIVALGAGGVSEKDAAATLPGKAAAAAPIPGSEHSAFSIPRTTLHGFGTIAASFHKSEDGNTSVTRITCVSPGKALLTQAKYLSDLACLPGTVRASLSQGSRTIPCTRAPSGGALACHARGREVLVFAANNYAALKRLVATAAPADAGHPEFSPRVAVPMWLDRWDRHGLLCYFAPEATPPGVSDRAYDYGDALTFAKENSVGLVVWTNPLVDDFAEGITNEQAWDWMQESARRLEVPVHVNTQISYPQLWLANRYREQTMLNAPQFLGGYYGVGHDSAGVGAVSWLSREAEDMQLGLFQHTVRRFAKDPNIVGWLEPHGETYEVPQKYFLDSGPYADEVLREFLRSRYKTLQALSERWHGDRQFLRSWNDVHVPEIAELVGFGPRAIDFQGAWRVKYLLAPDGHPYTQETARGLKSPPPAAPAPLEWFHPDFDDSGWDELTAPGNDRMHSMVRSPLVYRRTLELSEDWLTANPRRTVVIWDLINREQDVTVLYVNGQPAQEHSHRNSDQRWSHFDVTDALKPGRNLIVMQMPRALICYRAYITGESIAQYPELGARRNAKWADIVAWNIQSRGAQIRRGAEMIRQADPASSINFMAANDYADPVKQACRDYGGRFHDTGAMAGYWTEWNTLMMCGAGLPVTAEPGNGAPNIREFQLFWGRWLTEGVTGVHYFENWGEIAWNPEVLKVFKANLAMYQAVGKFHVPFANVAVLFSSTSEWLTGFPWTPDGGSRGGYESTFNAAGQLLNTCPRDGIGTEDFGTPLVDKYRVIIDSNSAFMDDRLVAGIEQYVRRGGVFITNGQTGRHTPEHPDTWPICRLTGYAVLPSATWNDGKSASPAPGQSIFTKANVPGQTRCSGLRLKRIAGDVRDLMLWEDGTPAVGMRRIGSGWIVHFGPMLYGEPFVTLIWALLEHFGAGARVPAVVTPQRGLHTRHFVGNTGLHDVWVLFNESDVAVTTDLTFLPGTRPSTLTDIVSKERLDIVRSPAGDAVRGITLAPWETRMVLSPRPGVSESPLEWLNVQCGWWQGTVTPPAKHLPTPAEMQRFTLDLTENWAYAGASGLTDDRTALLARPGVDDSTWQRRPLGLWLTPGDRTAKRHLLRRRFTVPAHWTNGVIALCADVPIAQFFHETRMFIDGTALANGRKSVDGPYFDTLDGLLKPGSTHLVALDIQDNGTLSGSRGPIWLSYLPEPAERQDLAGMWTAYADALSKLGEVEIPGSFHGMYLSRLVTIDRAHTDRNVVMYCDGSGDRFSVMVNGRLLKRGEQVREHITCFNVTPLVRFGEENRIELVTGSGQNTKSVARVEIRFYDKGVYP